MILYDYVFVKAEKETEDEIITAGGLKLWIDTTYNPVKHSRTYGIVTHLPKKLRDTGEPIYWSDNGKGVSPQNTALIDYGFKYPDSIKQEVKIGDKIYFFGHFNSREFHWVEIDNQFYIRIPYASIICAVRDNIIIPIGSNVLLEPFLGDNIVLTEILGKEVYVKKIGLIEIPLESKPEINKGIVRHIGTSLNGLELELKIGDKVLIPPKYDIKLKIEGKDYIIILQHEISAIYDCLY